jgi:AhpD family alkylhydroperoxidase
LRELIKLRVSQINGCAYCIDMHWKDARAGGETEQRLYGVAAWRESPYYSQRERAGLLLAEELTRIADRPVPDEIHEQAREQFNAQEVSDLVWTIAAINAWNRISIGSRTVPGDYQPPKNAR